MSRYEMEIIQHVYSIVRDRLEALINSGDGAIIHDALNRRDIIDGWKRVAEAEPSQYNRVVWREYIRTQEIWMEKLAMRGNAFAADVEKELEGK